MTGIRIVVYSDQGTVIVHPGTPVAFKLVCGILQFRQTNAPSSEQSSRTETSLPTEVF